ncbi:MAG: hypothetical protein AAGF71_08585 [Pseudomonadota bacterium]
MHTLTRRNVIATLSSSAVMLCPQILNARSLDLLEEWLDIPTTAPVGQASLVNVAAGPATLDITELGPGEVAVIARPTDDDNYSNTDMVQYVGVMRRTDEQIAYGVENDRAGEVQDPRFYVVNLLCPHRGKAIGITGDINRPFACTDRRGRHASDFSVSGEGVAGASAGEDWLSVPDHTLEITENDDVISKVVLQLA